MDRWDVTIDKRDLVDAVGIARTRATLRRKGSGFEPDVTLIACGAGLSIRSSYAGMDIPAAGTWPAPVMANGAGLRRLAPKLTGPEVRLIYEAGQLRLNGTSVPAKEV